MENDLLSLIPFKLGLGLMIIISDDFKDIWKKKRKKKKRFDTHYWHPLLNLTGKLVKCKIHYSWDCKSSISQKNPNKIHEPISQALAKKNQKKKNQNWSQPPSLFSLSLSSSLESDLSPSATTRAVAKHTHTHTHTQLCCKKNKKKKKKFMIPQSEKQYIVLVRSYSSGVKRILH